MNCCTGMIVGLGLFSLGKATIRIELLELLLQPWNPFEMWHISVFPASLKCRSGILAPVNARGMVAPEPSVEAPVPCKLLADADDAKRRLYLRPWLGR